MPSASDEEGAGSVEYAVAVADAADEESLQVSVERREEKKKPACHE